MTIKKTYVSDITGNDIEGTPKTITLQRSVTKKLSPTTYYGGRTYRTTENKTFHIGESELELLPEAIRTWLFPAPKEVKAKTTKTKTGAKS